MHYASGDRKFLHQSAQPPWGGVIIQGVKACAIPCLHQPPTRVITQFRKLKWVLPPLVLRSSFCHRTGYLKEIYIYIYIYTPDQLRAVTTLDIKLHFQSAVCDLKNKTKKKRVYFRRLMLLRVYSNRFLRNHTGMVVPRVFPSC